MGAVIYNPLEEYETTLRERHAENTRRCFEDKVRQSGVDIAANRETVRLYHQYRENVSELQKKLNRRRVLRVLLCMTVILIPVVLWKTTPHIRQLRCEAAEADQRAVELLAEAERQMAPLNALFTDRDALNIIESTVPLLSFEPCFSAAQEADMQYNYDFYEDRAEEQSALDVVAGHYNENPFLFEDRLIHTMGQETYHGYKTIHWEETHRDSDGDLYTETHSETLHASVVKPKPFFHTQVVLHYGTQAAPRLSFSRDASHLEQKSEKQIERLVKRGEKKLKKRTDRALRQNREFVSMSNTDFEVLFDALDRTDELQFRTLFTPLAQTNMVALLRSGIGYGDDFRFVKALRTNRIVSDHSQGRVVNLRPEHYRSYSYDTISERFVGKNAGFFKAVYFDLAPLLAIPAYQERPMHSVRFVPDSPQRYSMKECEALANAADRRYTVHPDTKTPAILKAAFVEHRNDADTVCVTAYSYDIEERMDFIPVHGGDGRYHDVPVPWKEYLPLETHHYFDVAADGTAPRESVIADRNGLGLFQS